MSRKITMRALPPGWNVEISQACDGAEALEACRQGKARIMFLDLTMPVMNGYQVLAMLKRERIDCLVIVVSADVQPKAVERAMALGAAAFIKKPVKAEEIAKVLEELGVL